MSRMANYMTSFRYSLLNTLIVFPLWLSCGTVYTLHCILIIYVLVSHALNHKFLRSGSISDSPPCCQTHSRFSIKEPKHQHPLWPRVALLLSFSVHAQCSIPMAFFPQYMQISMRKKDRGNLRRMRVASESSEEGDLSCLYRCWTLPGWTTLQNLLLHCAGGLCAPALPFVTTAVDHVVH